MQYRGVNELRKLFLDFFESKGHLKMKSFSLVPHNDNSLLIINSGMAPLKPYFTGQVTSHSVTTSKEKQFTGHGNSLQRLLDLMPTDFTHLFM